MSMDLDEYRRINTIIERDATDTTYKYALLRSLIDVCQQYGNTFRHEGDEVFFSLGLLVDRWIRYYFPLMASSIFIPQKKSESAERISGQVVSFRLLFEKITRYYTSHNRGGFSLF